MKEIATTPSSRAEVALRVATLCPAALMSHSCLHAHQVFSRVITQTK
jgi:hypothetical protein